MTVVNIFVSMVIVDPPQVTNLSGWACGPRMGDEITRAPW
jgi:hypothetical protein